MCPFTGQECAGKQCAFNEGYGLGGDYNWGVSACLILRFLKKELGK